MVVPMPVPVPSLDARGCRFVGTPVCVELFDELNHVGEDGREGVGLRAEEVSDHALVAATAECTEVGGLDG